MIVPDPVPLLVRQRRTPPVAGTWYAADATAAEDVADAVRATAATDAAAAADATDATDAAQPS